MQVICLCHRLLRERESPKLLIKQISIYLYIALCKIFLKIYSEKADTINSFVQKIIQAMIIVENVYVSDDIAESSFVCNLEKCKGACCVEGDSGAPLEEDELSVLQEIYEDIKPYMTEEGKQAIEEQGLYVIDSDGDYTTPTINHRECAFAIYDSEGILKCSIEQAYHDGKIKFPKPISCHLYPIRITKYDMYDAVNYHRWEICTPACELGKALKIPLYKFLKVPLTRKYGVEWYEELVNQIENL